MGISLYKCSRAGPQPSGSHPDVKGLSLKMAQKGSKKRKKAQKGSKRRSKRLFEPARCRQCARRGCSSLLRCRLCVRRGCSRLLFEITIQKCWSRLHCALSHCTLLCFALCMDMHGFTLVYLYKGSRAKGRSGAFHVPSRCLRHCSPQVPPGRSKWLFGPALVLPVHSKRLLGLLESDSVPPVCSNTLFEPD